MSSSVSATLRAGCLWRFSDRPAGHAADIDLTFFSAPSYSTALQAAVDYAWSKGVVIVAATGNDGSSSPAFPAGDRGVVAVSNTDQNHGLNASSNYDADTLLAAPGMDIVTIVPGGGSTSVTGISRHKSWPSRTGTVVATIC